MKPALQMGFLNAPCQQSLPQPVTRRARLLQLRLHLRHTGSGLSQLQTLTRRAGAVIKHEQLTALPFVRAVNLQPLARQQFHSHCLLRHNAFAARSRRLTRDQMIMKLRVHTFTPGHSHSHGLRHHSVHRPAPCPVVWLFSHQNNGAGHINHG